MSNFIAVLTYRGSIFRETHWIDVIELRPQDVSLIRVSISGSSPANLLEINGTPNTAADTDISVSSTTTRTRTEIRALTGSAGRRITISALNTANVVLQREEIFVQSDTMLYKRPPRLLGYASYLAEFEAKKNLLSRLRGRNYTWRVRLIPFEPVSASDEIVIEAGITYPFEIASQIETIAYGQGMDVRYTGENVIAKAELMPEDLKRFAALHEEMLFRRLERGETGTGYAMVEFYNELYSLTLNNVIVVPSFKLSANGAENNAENNVTELRVSLTGKTASEVISGLNWVDNPVI